MHKHLSHYLTHFSTLLILLTSPVASHSQNSYQVEYTAEFSRNKWTNEKLEALELSAEIYFDEVEVGSHPYAEAAFLEHASSLVVAYIDFDFTSTITDQDTTGLLLLADYIAPNSSLIIQAGYGATDGNIKGGINGSNDSDLITLSIGSYLSDRSTLIVNYIQNDGEINIPPSTTTYKTTVITLEYKQVEILSDGTTFNFEASIASLEQEIFPPHETNTIIGLLGDYYLNQSSSFGASLEINSGDDKGDEGKTLGFNLKNFTTPDFAVFAEFKLFTADNISGEDSDEIVVGAIARF